MFLISRTASRRPRANICSGPLGAIVAGNGHSPTTATVGMSAGAGSPKSRSLPLRVVFACLPLRVKRPARIGSWKPLQSPRPMTSPDFFTRK